MLIFIFIILKSDSTFTENLKYLTDFFFFYSGYSSFNKD